MNHLNHGRQLLSAAAVVLGNAGYSLTVALFLEPAGLVAGGATGVALAFGRLTGLSVSGFLLAFNLVMLAWGWVVLGRAFALNTLASSILSPIFLGLAETMLHGRVLTDDLFLNTVFAAIGVGAFMGIVIRAGASTGGMDIPPLVLNKRFGLPISGTMYVFDFLILLVQVPFTDLNRVMYGIVLVMVYTLTLDKLLSLGKRRVQLDVVTRRLDTLREALLAHTGPKTTMVVMPVECAGLPANMIRLILDPRDLHAVEETIRNADGEALIVENRIGEMKTK